MTNFYLRAVLLPPTVIPACLKHNGAKPPLQVAWRNEAGIQDYTAHRLFCSPKFHVGDGANYGEFLQHANYFAALDSSLRWNDGVGGELGALSSRLITLSLWIADHAIANRNDEIFFGVEWSYRFTHTNYFAALDSSLRWNDGRDSEGGTSRQAN